MKSDDDSNGVIYVTDEKDNLIVSIDLDEDNVIIKDGFKVFIERDNELQTIEK